MDVVVGGNRLGSGSKMHARLHNYYRSTHNLTEKFTSSAGVGILYPYMCKLMMRGDRFDINSEADVRTIPAKGALFGSFKLQIDTFFCPIRLYVGLLHNNPRGIGLKMNQVKWPTMTIETKGESDGVIYKAIGFSNNCLMKYLGMSGLGNSKKTSNSNVSRTIEAIPMLAYYDIYKNYYANKQEDKGYYIKGKSNPNYTLQTSEISYTNYDDDRIYKRNVVAPYDYNNILLARCDIAAWNYSDSSFQINAKIETVIDEGKDYLTVRPSTMDEARELVLWAWAYPSGQYYKMKLGDFIDSLTNVLEIGIDQNGILDIVHENETGIVKFTYNNNQYTLGGISFINNNNVGSRSGIILESFPLQNLDDMRYNLLSHHTMGVGYNINSALLYPYRLNVMSNEGITLNKFPLNGLCIKTYQNDIFNNWLNTTWIEGQNGISDITAVTVTNGEFSIDELSFKEKLYNLLNRIAIAGNTYEDWQDVVYEEKPKMHMETPIFVGGMSKEIVFDEVIQTSQTNENKALGTMGGRGRANQEGKGGHYVVKADEAGFLIGIVSITPRINYNQCNEFYLTEIQSMDDLHKPGMDGIGFQDLIGERMAYFDTNLDGPTPIKHKIGKLPAWIEYMTSVDRTFGDFAYSGDNEDIPSYMVLNRNYELNESIGQIKDATTYIDPAKYNYAFAYTALDSQNFWIQIKSHIEARRKMSARIIPNV